MMKYVRNECDDQYESKRRAEYWSPSPLFHTLNGGLGHNSLDGSVASEADWMAAA